MTNFEKELIAQREYQAQCYAAGAKGAARRGCPEHAKTLARRAEFHRRMAEDARRAAEWEDERQCQHPPF